MSYKTCPRRVKTACPCHHSWTKRFIDRKFVGIMATLMSNDRNWRDRWLRILELEA